jgi:polyisoprenoid-binding protein YceI
MQRRKLFWIASISCAGFWLSAAGHAGLSSASDAHVTFQASGPAGLKIEGTTTDFKATEENGSLVIDVPLANLATGIALRDHHMKEKYLEVPKYPAASLIVARSALKMPAGADRTEADVPGTLKLHGQSRPVSVHYDAKADGASFAAHGKFRINMNDFGIIVPSYLGVTVKPDVEVSASFHVAGT